MKKVGLYLVFIMVITSCSKCYECSHLVVVEIGNSIMIDTVNEEFCTVLEEEIEAKEIEGYNCKVN